MRILAVGGHAVPAFHTTRIDRYRDDMVRSTEDLVGRYRADATRDVHADMTELTPRSATRTLFGVEEGASRRRATLQPQAPSGSGARKGYR